MLDAFFAVPLLAACLVGSQPAPRPQPPSRAASLTPVSLLPARFEAGTSEQLALRLEGTDSAALAWSAHPISWFAIRVAGSQENADQAPGAGAGLGGLGAPVSIPLRAPGVTMIGAEFAPVTIQLTREQLRAALDPLVATADLDKATKDLPPVPADKAVRVRLVCSAKTFVRVLPADPKAPIPIDAQTVGSKFGFASEIRTLLNPLESLVGGDITLRFHADYDKAARTRAFAVNLDTGRSQEFAADGSGIGRFHMNEPGRWRLHFATARALPAGSDADVVVYSSTVTFAATRVEGEK